MTEPQPAHSHIGASSSDRWMNCPGSVALSRGIEDTGSAYAREGTAAHYLGLLALVQGVDPADVVGDAIDITDDRDPVLCDREPDGDRVFEVTEEMAEAVQVYVDTTAPFKGPNHEWRAEHRFDLSELHPGMFGTADFSDYDTATQDVTVVDFKYGRGVAVEVDANPQLLYYALGVVRSHHNRGIRKVRIGIVQPRCPHPKGPVRWYECDALDLLEWSNDLIEGAKRTEDPNAPLFAGDWCKFCPAAAICPELRDRATRAAELVFNDLTETFAVADPTSYDPATLAACLREVDLVEDWCRRVRETAHHEAEAGRMPPGFKLVPTRPRRVWKDEEAARSFTELYGLDDVDVYERKFKSPAKMEKVVGKKEFAASFGAHVESRSGGTVLAPLDDPREPVRAEAEAVFAGVPIEGDPKTMSADDLLEIPANLRRTA